MMPLLGWSVFAVMSVIAVLHAYWAVGGLWPAATEADLVKTVIGITRSQTMPPGLHSMAVAVLVFAAAGFALARGAFGFDSLIFSRIPLGIIAIIMLARGIYAYLPGLFSRASEPFASLNAMFFSPAILLLGVAFACLALGPTTR
jgi:hypothetical protein|tara:strand:- start:4830 stop:5264 length:435 start_codon:yes stop_codon:yes gene_type:complete